MDRCNASGKKPHPARYPVQLPSFFLNFLTNPGDLVLDPFAGSNTAGEACEGLKRKWIAIESEREYLEASRFRFEETGEVVGRMTNGKARTRRRKVRANGSAPSLFA